jgi:hypothetical protein
MTFILVNVASKSNKQKNYGTVCAKVFPKKPFVSSLAYILYISRILWCDVVKQCGADLRYLRQTSFFVVHAV